MQIKSHPLFDSQSKQVLSCRMCGKHQTVLKMDIREQNLFFLVHQALMIAVWDTLANKKFQLNRLHINHRVKSGPDTRTVLGIVNTCDLTLGTFRGMFGQNLNEMETNYRTNISVLISYLPWFHFASLFPNRL